MANVIQTRILLPPVADPDVRTRELLVSINGGPAAVTTLGLTDASVDKDFDQDAAVHLELVDVDDAGNRSAPSLRDFVATDTVPPAQPGQIDVQILGEV